MPRSDIHESIDLLAWERQLWDGGYTQIAGVDEVGRGALAGPLVAAAVILPFPAGPAETQVSPVPGLRDSKTLSARRRTDLAAAISATGALIGIGMVEADEIDAIGINPANRAAMERAVMALPVEPDMLLIDAVTIDLDTPQIGVIDGDAQSLSIAAASIMAKVTRDALMVDLHATWPVFAFDRHKGYGVKAHLEALQQHGPCPLHRRSFAPVRHALPNGTG